MFEHCLSEWKERQKQEAYRVYITDALRAISENTAKYAGGKYIQARYADMIKPKPKDIRSGNEIAADVIKKAGLKLVKKGG